MKKYVVIDKDNNVIGASEGAYFEMEGGVTVEVFEEIDYPRIEGLKLNNEGFLYFDEERYLNKQIQVLKDDLRNDRETECFDVVNRGDIWYKKFVNTPEREIEFEAWYQAWLDVTETLEKPIKPEWI